MATLISGKSRKRGDEAARSRAPILMEWSSGRSSLLARVDSKRPDAITAFQGAARAIAILVIGQ